MPISVNANIPLIIPTNNDYEDEAIRRSKHSALNLQEYAEGHGYCSSTLIDEGHFPVRHGFCWGHYHTGLGGVIQAALNLIITRDNFHDNPFHIDDITTSIVFYRLTSTTHEFISAIAHTNPRTTVTYWENHFKEYQSHLLHYLTQPLPPTKPTTRYDVVLKYPKEIKHTWAIDLEDAVSWYIGFMGSAMAALDIALASGLSDNFDDYVDRIKKMCGETTQDDGDKIKVTVRSPYAGFVLSCMTEDGMTMNELVENTKVDYICTNDPDDFPNGLENEPVHITEVFHVNYSEANLKNLERHAKSMTEHGWEIEFEISKVGFSPGLTD